MTILIQQVDEYSMALSSSPSAGIKVLVHDQLDPPFADTHGVVIQPGVHALIAIKKKKVCVPVSWAAHTR